jgi:hypothetical protein
MASSTYLFVLTFESVSRDMAATDFICPPKGFLVVLDGWLSTPGHHLHPPFLFFFSAPCFCVHAPNCVGVTDGFLERVWGSFFCGVREILDLPTSFDNCLDSRPGDGLTPIFLSALMSVARSRSSLANLRRFVKVQQDLVLDVSKSGSISQDLNKT